MSSRWLISKGRGEEAFAILAKYHAEGNLDSELVKLEWVVDQTDIYVSAADVFIRYAQIETTLELETEHANRSSIKEMFATSGTIYHES